jgi:hypothetical protein
MHYLHITTETESNIGVLKLPKLKMVVPKVDSIITKAIEAKLPQMIGEHFDSETEEIKSITIYNRVPLTIEVSMVITDEIDGERELTVYANETWVY